MMELDAERHWRFIGAQEGYDGARAVIVGAPLDTTMTFRAGARHAPREIRQFSWVLEEYSPRLGRDLGELRFCDLGDLCLPWGNVREGLRRIRETAERLVRDGKLPVFIGGEHLVSLPAVEAVAERYPGLAVLQLDAHADLLDDYLGERYSHATVMRRVAEVVGGENVYQLGIRSGAREEFEYGQVHTHIFLHEVLRPLEKIARTLNGRPVYVTVDIDVVDPAYAPGTGTPEPGGCSSLELMEAIYLLRGLHVVGFDLVEVNPVYDLSGRTAVLAAKVIREMLLVWANGARHRD
ncbi:MAG: agmatinase [Desulfotomaculales bacterium]